jgi:hypothetical protein
VRRRRPAPVVAAGPVLAIGLIFAIGLAGPAAARTLEVGPGRAYALPSLAAAAAQDGDRVVISPGRYRDCAVWRQSDLVIEAAAEAAEGSVEIAESICQGKGIFVITGNRVTVRGLTLARARVPAGNGAGIRAEGGDLTVERVRFVANENGILSGGRNAAVLWVKDSAFIGNGSCAHACAHGIYAGHVGLLRVERSRFLGTVEGHHIKSRADRTEVTDCDIADGPDGTASYLIDIPYGGTAILRGNRLAKGPRSGNRGVAISIGAEGVARVTDEILLEDNVLRVEGGYSTVFLDNRTPTPALLRRNRLGGGAVPLRGRGEVLG